VSKLINVDSEVLDVFKVGWKGRFMQWLRKILEIDDATGVKDRREYIAEGPRDSN